MRRYSPLDVFSELQMQTTASWGIHNKQTVEHYSFPQRYKATVRLQCIGNRQTL